MAWKDNIGVAEELKVEMVDATVEVSIDALEEIAFDLIQPDVDPKEVLKKVRALLQ